MSRFRARLGMLGSVVQKSGLAAGKLTVELTFLSKRIKKSDVSFLD